MPGTEKLDGTDGRILEILQADGRMPYADVGAAIGMSGPSAHERVKKLEARGVIRGYVAVVDPIAVDLGLLAFMFVKQAPGTVAHDLTDDFAAIPEIEECHHIAGEADYLLKVRASDTRDLERLLHAIQVIHYVLSTETQVVFSSPFERRPLPVVREDETGRGGEA
ncbi:MAG: Lrp/AsnC family transcriptional regulator [Candidatus Limnocylindrales bacterium]